MAEQARRSAEVAAVFDRAADAYDNVGVAWFTPIAERLVREVAPRQGERALDVGCGRGAALFALAEAVGPSGRVTGIDLAPRMVDLTRDAVRDRGLTNVDIWVMDASSPRLPSTSYDVVVGSLVAFFLPDPGAALRRWRELLVPGGRLAISTIAGRDPRWNPILEIFRPYLPPQMRDRATSGVADPFESDAGVEGLVTSAGFGRVRTVGFDVATAFADFEQWHAWSWSHGQRAVWDAIPEAEREAVRSSIAEHLDDCRDADGRIRLAQPMRLTLAEA